MMKQEDVFNFLSKIHLQIKEELELTSILGAFYIEGKLEYKTFVYFLFRSKTPYIKRLPPTPINFFRYFLFQILTLSAFVCVLFRII